MLSILFIYSQIYQKALSLSVRCRSYRWCKWENSSLHWFPISKWWCGRL